MFFGHTELGMWDLSSLTRGQIHTPCIGTLTLNHWATRDVPCFKFFCDKKKNDLLTLLKSIPAQLLMAVYFLPSVTF